MGPGKPSPLGPNGPAGPGSPLSPYNRTRSIKSKRFYANNVKKSINIWNKGKKNKM